MSDRQRRWQPGAGKGLHTHHNFQLLPSGKVFLMQCTVLQSSPQQASRLCQPCCQPSHLHRATSWVAITPVHYATVQYSTVQCTFQYTKLYSTVHYSTLYSTITYSVQYSQVHYTIGSGTLYNTIRCTVQYSHLHYIIQCTVQSDMLVSGLSHRDNSVIYQNLKPCELQFHQCFIPLWYQFFSNLSLLEPLGGQCGFHG